MVRNSCRAIKKSCSKLSVAALSILVVGTALGNFVSAAEVHPTISTQGQVSASDLKEVTAGLRSKISSFLTDGLKASTSRNKYDFITKTTINTDPQAVISSDQKGESTLFIDVDSSADRHHIETLALKGIIRNSKKFYPNNFIRLNELVKMLVNSYRFKAGYNMTESAGLTDKVYFDTAMPKYYNTAYEMGILEGIENLNDYERFITYYDLVKILKNLKIQYPNLVNLYYLDIPEGDTNLKRGDVTRVIFKTMMIDNETGSYFDDTVYHKHESAIQTLAENGIVNVSNSKFYPDRNITRREYIIMFMNAYLKHQKEHVEFGESITELLGGLGSSSLADVGSKSDSDQLVLYAKSKGFIDYLLESSRGETYLRPDSSLTKHEAYYIISKITGKDFLYDIISADKEYITRGEVAELIKDGFGIVNSKNSNTASSGLKINFANTDSHIGRLINSIITTATEGKKIASAI